MEMTMEILGARMVVLAEETTKSLEQASKSLDHIQRKRRWVINQIKRLAGEIRTRAEQFHQEAAACDGALSFCADMFEMGLRAVSGAAFMAASGVEKQNASLITLAHMAQQEGTKVMLASWVATQPEPDQSPAVAVETSASPA